MSQYGKYGLPIAVEFCKKCTINNQRPSSSIEFSREGNEKKKPIIFDSEGICSACVYAEKKRLIDWTDRSKQLEELCDRYRRGDGRYDVIVPGSGGKDSVVAAHMLKFKYNMNPLLITWPPALYTDIGRRNFDAWLNSGFGNITYHQNKKLHRFLTKLSLIHI